MSKMSPAYVEHEEERKEKKGSKKKRKLKWFKLAPYITFGILNSERNFAQYIGQSGEQNIRTDSNEQNLCLAHHSGIFLSKIAIDRRFFRSSIPLVQPPSSIEKIWLVVFGDLMAIN